MREHRARGDAMRRSCQSVTLLLAIVAHARDTRAAWCDPRSEIQSLFDRVAAAIGRKDIDGVAEYVLPTARLKSKDGHEADVAEWKERMRDAWADLKRMKARIVVESIVPCGQDVEVRYTETLDFVMIDGHVGDDHKVLAESKFLARMRKSETGWRANRIVELDHKATIDGLPVELDSPKDK